MRWRVVAVVVVLLVALTPLRADAVWGDTARARTTTVTGSLAAPVITCNLTDLTLAWAPVPGATSYEIKKNGGLLSTLLGSLPLVGGLLVGTIDLLGLLLGGSITYTVTAKVGTWTSPPGTVTVSKTLLGAVTCS